MKQSSSALTVLTTLTTALILGFATHSPAVTLSGAGIDVKGNRYAQAARADEVFVSDERGGHAYLKKRLTGKLLTKEKTFADVALEAHSTGGSVARVVLAGREVVHAPITPSWTVLSLPKTLQPALNVRKSFAFAPLVEVTLRAEAGTGALVAAQWFVNATRPQGTLKGLAESWGYGEGEIGLRVLAGLVSAKAVSQLDFFDTMVIGNLIGEPGKVLTSEADLVIEPWKLAIALKGKVLGASWSKKLVDRSGPFSFKPLI